MSLITYTVFDRPNDTGMILVSLGRIKNSISPYLINGIKWHTNGALQSINKRDEKLELGFRWLFNFSRDWDTSFGVF